MTAFVSFFFFATLLTFPNQLQTAVIRIEPIVALIEAEELFELLLTFLLLDIERSRTNKSSETFLVAYSKANNALST